MKELVAASCVIITMKRVNKKNKNVQYQHNDKKREEKQIELERKRDIRMIY